MSDATQAPVPGLEPCGLLEVQVSEPIELGSTRLGVRRAVPVQGGRMSGSIGTGEILGGWDWQTVHADGSLSIDASYPVRLDDGTVVTVTTVGVRDPNVDPPYFRLVVTITGPTDRVVEDGPLLIASGVRVQGTVTLEIYRVT